MAAGFVMRGRRVLQNISGVFLRHNFEVAQRNQQRFAYGQRGVAFDIIVRECFHAIQLSKLIDYVVA